MDKAGSWWAIAIPDALTGFVGTIAAEHQHEAWRYTLMSGLIPAIPFILIRPFLPESPVWAAEAGRRKFAGGRASPNSSPPSCGERRSSPRSCSLAAMVRRLAPFSNSRKSSPGLADVKAKAQGAVEKLKLPPDEAAAKKMKIGAQRQVEQKIASEYTKVQEIGGLLGRVLLAFLAVRIVGRRNLLRVFQGPGLILVPLIFAMFLRVENRTFFELNLESVYLGKLPITTMSLAVALAGLVTVAQFSFWGNYLPLVYPSAPSRYRREFCRQHRGTHARHVLRAGHGDHCQLRPRLRWPRTVEVCLHVGRGRVFVYLVGSIACFWLPEPNETELEA